MLLDYAPFYPGHTLIVPKQHVVEVDELNDVVAKSVMDASKLIAKAIKIVYKPDGVTVCQNGGVFNELTHYHMHVVPRYKERSFAEFYMVQPGEKQNHNLEETQNLLKEAIEHICLLKRRSGQENSNIKKPNFSVKIEKLGFCLFYY